MKRIVVKHLIISTHPYRLHTWAETCGRVWGGRNKFFADISEKMSIFMPKNSDDLFLVIDQVFLILTLSFHILCVFIVSNVIYDPFFTTKSPLSTKNSLMTPIFLLSLGFRAHPTTLLLIILGGPMLGPSPTSNFGGTVPPVPPRSPPLIGGHVPGLPPQSTPWSD